MWLRRLSHVGPGSTGRRAGTSGGSPARAEGRVEFTGVPDDSAGPVCVALVNDYEVVVKGLRDMLADFSERVQVVEIDLGVEVDQHVDVALYDCFSALPLTSDDLDALVAQPEIGAVAVYTWSSRDDLVETALAKGVRGYLSKAMDATALVAALERIASGEQVVVRETGARSDGDGPAAHEQILGDWPGRTEGLTARQAEIVCLITQGLSNSEICERTYLTLNTVKSYIRDAYRTMGVTTRVQAVLWGVEHGLTPTRARHKLDG